MQWTLNGRPPAVVVYNLANRGSRIHADHQVPLLTWGEGIETAKRYRAKESDGNPLPACVPDGAQGGAADNRKIGRASCRERV